MGVPFVTHISPATGPTGGRRVVKILGGNFQLAPTPPATGVAPVPNPSVEVLFGDVPARETRVMAKSLLHVLTPIHDPGPCSLTVRNIDQDGAVVASETVTIAAAYTFARPTVGAQSPGAQSNLTRLTRAVIDEFKRQVLENVVLTTHSDYDDTPDGANVAALASIPGLVLSGPVLYLDRFFSENQPREAEDADGDTFQQWPARTVDVGFTLIAIDELATRELDLVSECTSFFARNIVMRLLRSAAVPGVFVEYEMEIEDDFKSIGGPSNSNLRASQLSFRIRGFDIDEADMAAYVAPALTESPALTPEGAPVVAPEVEVPNVVYLTGTPGVTSVAPVPSGPPAGVVGNPGPIEQIPPTE